MDDLSKILGGFGMYEKLFSSSNALTIASLSNPLHKLNWNHPRDEYLSMKAITGQSIHLWEALTKVPDYNGMSAIMGANQWINSFKNANPYLDSLSVLSGKMNWLSLTANHPTLNQTNNWSKSLLGNSATEILSKYYISNDWNNSINFWSNLIHSQSLKQIKVKKKETNNIERFADNVASVYSEVENFDDSQKNTFASKIAEILNYEIEIAKDMPTFSLVLEWILNKYNSAIESAIIKRNIDEIKKIYSDLKAITIVGWLAIIITAGGIGIIESEGGKLWQLSTSKSEPIVMQSRFSYNATTNNQKEIRVEPDGRTKLICTIPDCTKVQLGEIVGKYVQITCLYNGSIVRGWTLNNQLCDE